MVSWTLGDNIPLDDTRLGLVESVHYGSFSSCEHVTSAWPSCVQVLTSAQCQTFTYSSRCALFPGIYESDDINAIMSEIEKALNFSQKVCLGLGFNTRMVLVSNCHGSCNKILQAE